MKDLNGVRILVTRPLPQAEETAEAIRLRGGVPILFPCLAVECLPWNPDEVLPWLKDPSNVTLFTSANAVHCVHRTLGKEMVQAFAHARIAVVGRKTAAALKRVGLTPALIPSIESQEGLIEPMKRASPKRLIFFRAEQGKDTLIQALTQLGIPVELVPVYRTVGVSEDASEVRHKLASGQIDVVLLGSTRSTQQYLARIGDIGLASKPRIAVISPAMAKEVMALGLKVDIIAKEASFKAMLDDVADHLRCVSERPKE